MARKKPAQVKQYLIKMVQDELGPDYDVATHFTPRYNPWDQRLCLVPDSDLFQALKSGKASVATDQIERFTPKGIRLKSGADLEADIIVTATGLKLIMLGGMQVSVDGVPKNMSKTMTYKGMMYSDVPNFVSAFGYTNASWTLKCDLTCEFICRLINHMDRKGYDFCVPTRDPTVEEMPWFDFSSGYIERARDVLPRQGVTKPWRLYQNYALDMVTLRFGGLDDGTIRFGKASGAVNESAPAVLAAE